MKSFPLQNSRHTLLGDLVQPKHAMWLQSCQLNKQFRSSLQGRACLPTWFTFSQYCLHSNSFFFQVNVLLSGSYSTNLTLYQIEQLQTMAWQRYMVVMSEKLMNLFCSRWMCQWEFPIAKQKLCLVNWMRTPCSGYHGWQLCLYTLKQERSDDAGSPKPEPEPWQGSVPDLSTCGHQKCLKKRFSLSIACMASLG